MSSININSMLGISSNSSSSDSSLLGGVNLSNYAAIKNGSYAKLTKAYYKQTESEEAATYKDSDSKLTSIKSGADSLKEAADALANDSLWEKKTIKTKNEETGEETEKEDYDWEAITKAVNKFAEAYNNVLDSSAESDTKGVLLNAGWMVGNTAKFDNLLSNAGITIGSDNKLSVDEEELKKADISTLKVLFNNANSLTDAVSSKAASISRAAANAGSTTYTSSGTLSSVYGSFQTEG